MSKRQSLMRAAMSQLNLSARACHRILELACTIADLVGSEEIQSVHRAEALHAHLHCNMPYRAGSAAQVSRSAEVDAQQCVMG
jgi:predicted ATPase with chaperone activity